MLHSDRVIQSGSMRKGVFHKQHDNHYKNSTPTQQNKSFVFVHFDFHFFSFESSITTL